MKNLFITAALASGVLSAQEHNVFFFQQPAPGAVHIDTAPVAERLRSPAIEARRIVMNGQTMEFVSGINVGPTVTGAPYAAEAVSESIQTLYDGNRIVQKSSTKVYRDSEGRERREEGSPMNVIFISDPVAKVSYTLHPDTMTAEKSSVGNFFLYNASAVNTITPAPMQAPSAGRMVVVPRSKQVTVTVGPGPGSAKVENLGTRTIEGVQATGTRATTVIPAGEIGNDRDIEIVDERWYSPDLKLTVMTRHADPRTGETTYKLLNIQRLEQVRSLFEVPSNYKITEGGVFNRLGIFTPGTAGPGTVTSGAAKKPQ